MKKSELAGLVREVLAEQENDQLASALKQTFNQLGKELTANDDKIADDNVDEAIGLAIAGVTLAIPEIVRLIGSVVKRASKFFGATGKSGDQIIALSKKMHSVLVYPIEKALMAMGLKDKDKAHKVAGAILTVVIAGLAIASGAAAIEAFKKSSVVVGSAEGALTAIKSGEIGSYLARILRPLAT